MFITLAGLLSSVNAQGWHQNIQCYTESHHNWGLIMDMWNKYFTYMRPPSSDYYFQTLLIPHSPIRWSKVHNTCWSPQFSKCAKLASKYSVLHWKSSQLRTNYGDIWNKYFTYTVDSRYLAPVGSQNLRARVKWFSRYLALSREDHDSRLQDHRPTLPGVYNSQTVCWAIIEVLTFLGSLHTWTLHQRQSTTSNIWF